MPFGVVIAIATHRVCAIRVLRAALEQDPGLRQRLEALRAHPRDAEGRNWNVPGLAIGTRPHDGVETEFRRVVDALRDEFDLA